MSSSNEKIELLDDKFLECESVKNEAVEKIAALHQDFQSVISMLEGQDMDKVESILEKLKSFLSSALNTISSIQNNINSITGEFQTVQNVLREMGAK